MRQGEAFERFHTLHQDGIFVMPNAWDGVSALRQANYHEDCAGVFRKSYDDFFRNLGAVLGPENLYSCPVPIPEKPLQEVKRGHKLRTKEKRAFKREVASAVRLFFQVNRRTGDESLPI